MLKLLTDHFMQTFLISTFTTALIVGCGALDQPNQKSSQPGLNLYSQTCSACEGQKRISGEILSNKARQIAPNVDDNDFRAQISSNNDFAFDLFHLVRGQPDNIFFSPYSISLTLAMLYGGAQNATEAQMANALNFTLPQSVLHPALNKLDLEIASRGQNNLGANGKAFRLKVVNALWGQKNYSFLPAYLDLLAENYGAGLRVVDFSSDPTAARNIINKWVEQKTENRISQLLSSDAVTSQTRMVITNAVYFNAAWAKPFDPQKTSNKFFQLPDGSKVNLPTMQTKITTYYSRGEDFQAVALPYDGQELSMLILVPDQGRLAPFEQSLNGPLFKRILSQMHSYEVTLNLPKFTFSQEIDLNKALRKLGMTDAFIPGLADFSNINGETDLALSGIFHKAFINVNEAGTEAGAATGSLLTLLSLPQPVKLNIDRPFIFVIFDHESGAILFIGRVLNPASIL